MRDFSQIDLVDMSRRKHDLAEANDNSQPEAHRDSPVIDWLGARKPLHLIAMACAIIALISCLLKWLG